MTDFLLIDASERQFKLALSYGGRKEFFVSSSASDTSGALLAAVEGILERGGAKLSEIGILACVIGPGSFTGCRIGAATVKGLAFGASKKLVAVNSLELAAYNINAGIDVMSIVPCVGGWYYAAVYREGREVSAPKAYRKEELDGMIAGGGFVLAGRCGDFAGLCQTAASKDKDSEGSAYFALTEDKISRGEFCTDGQLLPLYLRKSQAEEARESGL